MLNLLLGRDWMANQDEIFRRIAADVHAEQPGRILMVPELISHEAERRLCAEAGDTASRFAEVLSFTRLARRVSEQVGSAAQECLDNGGRVVAMAAAARQLASRLKAYAAVETKPEFLTELIDGVDEFKRCCITPADLQIAAQATEGSLSQKLEELSLLMESYDALCARGKRDPRDQMFWLLEQLEQGDFAQKHVFYIDGFPDLTRQHMAILEHLITASPNVTVSLNCDRVDAHLLAFEKAGATAKQLVQFARHAGIEVHIELIPEKQRPMQMLREALFQGPIREGAEQGRLHAVRAETPWKECMAAADLAAELVRGGCRYRDIALVCTDINKYQNLVRMIFKRMGIPVYQSGTEDILQKSMIATVLTALEAALSGFDQRNVLRYLRSALSPLEPDTCDLVENYAVIWGIRGSQWTKGWENHPEGLKDDWSEADRERLNFLNEARAAAIDPLVRLHEGFQSALVLRDQVMALYRFLEELQLEARLAEMAEEMDRNGDNRGAQILNQLWEILMSALEQMYDVLGETVWEPEHFARLLRLLLSQYDVGTIPPVLDAVQMGPVNAMRCHCEKYLIVLGAEEGCLPGYSGSKGVLTDQERVELRALGVPLTGGAMEGIQEEFAEIYGVFCGAVEGAWVFCSGEQPSFVFRRLAELSGGTENAAEGTEFAQADELEAAAWLAQYGAVETADHLGLSDSYQAVCRRRDHKLGKIEKEHIQSLYGRSLLLSASQVDKQADCRLQYFLQYGLKAKERKEVTIDPAEFGTYVHDVLEHTAGEVKKRGGFHKVSKEETLDIARGFSDDYAQKHFGQLQSERFRYLFRRNMQELDMVVEELWEELSRSGFEPEGFEVHFGDNGALPAIQIPNDAMKAALQGFVDRVDLWKSVGSQYYRIVDYKTGRKKFDYCDVFNGIGLQMLLYMFALRKDGEKFFGEKAYPAGVQYFPARVPYVTTDGSADTKKEETERKKLRKRSGLLLKDEAVLNAMEPDDPDRIGYKVKDGELEGDLADRDQLRQLEQYVFRVLKNMVEEIASGTVEPNPYTRGTSHNACAFCPYGTVCHSEEVAGRRNYEAMKPQRFWEEIGKELSRHG